MPADQKQQVAAAVKRAVESPEFTSKLPTGIESAYSPSADFAKQIQSEQAYYKDLIKTLNLKVE
jgi:tripartite-type tricarboxylate transporter receptor subunit TctC